MDALVELNAKLVAVGRSDLPGPLKALAKAPLLERMIAGVFQIFIMPTLDIGSVDFLPEDAQQQVVY